MLSVADLFVHIPTLIDDATADNVVRIPPRPGPPPRCSDGEVLTVTLVRPVPGRAIEAGWLAEVRHSRRHLRIHLPVQSELNRRVR